MDAPNAPNPANPNAQDQFVDMVQGPANQAQGPAVQNQVQGPTVQDQAQSPAVPNSSSRSCSPHSSSRSCKQQCSGWSKYTHAAATTTGPSTTSPHRSGSACPPGSLSKLDRKET